MEKTKLITTLVVVIVIVAAVAVLAIYFLNSEQNSVEIDAANLIYGNANNDAYINQDDIDALESIISGESSWDSVNYPLADANNDGSITQADIDLVEKIINRESTTVWYQNYLGWAQEISFPLKNKNIAVMYWQQAEAAAILGLWDNVKVANAYVTQIKTDQYDLSHVVEVEYTSTNYWEDKTFLTFADQNIEVVMVTPNESNYNALKAGYLDAHPECEVILLSHVGTNAIPSILTMGILFDAEDKSLAYAEYCYKTIDDIQNRLTDVTPKNVIVTMTYPTSSSSYKVCSGVDYEGSVNIISLVANVYESKDTTEYGQVARDQLWFTEPEQDAYDVIFMNYSSIDWFTCGNQETFNEYFDNVSEYYAGTNAYKNNGMVAMPYVCGGYASYAMLYYVAWMLYPDTFTLEEGQEHLQYWFDNFCCDKNNKLASHELTAYNAYIYYTGSNYTTLTQLYDKQQNTVSNFVDIAIANVKD